MTEPTPGGFFEGDSSPEVEIETPALPGSTTTASKGGLFSDEGATVVSPDTPEPGDTATQTGGGFFGGAFADDNTLNCP